jgi:5-(carboxyamino)imidazole ribonucleotide mutase
MPPGIPVATMAINGGLNAGLMAATMLGATNSAVKEKVAAYKENLNKQVLTKAQNLEEIGYAAYLKQMGL